jgi:hypothetical protein
MTMMIFVSQDCTRRRNSEQTAGKNNKEAVFENPITHQESPTRS